MPTTYPQNNTLLLRMKHRRETGGLKRGINDRSAYVLYPSPDNLYHEFVGLFLLRAVLQVF
jgi:hypothetical protein